MEGIELLGIIALLIIVGFLIKTLGKAIMNIGIGIAVIIGVMAILIGLSAMGFY